MSDRDEVRARYAGYDVLAKWSSPDWDDQTRDVVRRRIEEVPPVRFLTTSEMRTLACAADRIIPQTERAAEERVPIAPRIDAKLADDLRDGYRYEGMPPLREAWRSGLAGIDETSRVRLGRDFADREIMRAAGGMDPWAADRTAHLLGTCRMGTDPADSVVDANCRAHDVPNLFVCDGSVFRSGTGVNPSLTIEAIAARTADRITDMSRRHEL